MWLGKGDGAFQEYSSVNIVQNGITLPTGPSSLVGAVGDLDGDGNADAVILANRVATDTTLDPSMSW